MECLQFDNQVLLEKPTPLICNYDTSIHGWDIQVHLSISSYNTMEIWEVLGVGIVSDEPMRAM